MKLKIKAGSLATNLYLTVDDDGVTFCETVLFGGKRRFGYQQIQCLLLSPSNTLSFQVGNEVFSIPVNLATPQHRQTVQTLVQNLNRTVAAGQVAAGL